MEDKFMIETETRTQALDIMNRMNLDLESAINLLMYYMVYFDGWPFRDEYPLYSKEIIEAIKDIDDTFKEIRED